VAPDVAGDLTAAHGVADHGCVSEAERFKQFRKVVSIGIHLVAIPRLAGSAMAATIMSNAAIAMGGQEDHLGLPGVRIEIVLMLVLSFVFDAPLECSQAWPVAWLSDALHALLEAWAGSVVGCEDENPGARPKSLRKAPTPREGT
jgi:hypothetical protein